MKHLTSVFDLTAADVESVLDRAADLKTKFLRGERPAVWQGRVLTQVFEKPSLRTRVSFEAAAAQLGGSCVFLSAKEAGLGGRESLADVARVLSGYSDAIALRTFSQQLINDFAASSSCPVINALSDDSHPCQALADVFTVREALGRVAGKTLAFIGDGNNVAHSLAIISGLVGMRLVLCTPPGYELPDAFLRDVKRRIPKAKITTTRDPRAAVKSADVVYTDVWASMGQESQADQRKAEFAPYQINAALLAAAPPECLFMHCLPARRGEEVTGEVLDGPQSIAFPQAENRMHLAKGLLVWLTEQD
ncbi:MAG: ornithine carbamoyltransferase [Planctomycetaceae bacterium]